MLEQVKQQSKAKFYFRIEDSRNIATLALALSHNHSFAFATDNTSPYTNDKPIDH